MQKINLERLKACMRRGKEGKRITIGFLGGSITQGSLATAEENTYAYGVYTWWKNSFPTADIHYVNGGIGGTSSHYGVSRAVTDLLMYQPDFVVVDFSVNDEGNTFFEETYEGVIRKLLLWPSEPAVLILNNVFYDTGANAQAYHNRVGDYYGIPHVSIRDTLYQEIQQGFYTREELTPDGLHPNDKGHALVARQITHFLDTVKLHVDEPEETWGISAPLTANAYEQAKRLTIREISPELNGFYADAREKLGHLDHFKNGWIGEKNGDRICFDVEASCIAIQYRKTIQKPAAKARLILDQDWEHPVLLDGNFDEDWGDCLYLQPVLHHGVYGAHRLEIEIIDAEGTNITPFYLMAVIVA